MPQKQELLLKKKSKVKTEQKLNSSQRLALHSVQKQLQLLQLKEWLVVIGFVGGAALLRVPMQTVPSAEPITFFAILAGWLFGKKKGFVAGAAAGYLSNFVTFGGQGPWTIFMVLGWGIAGFLGGFIKDIKETKSAWLYWLKSIIPVLLIVTISSVSYDIITNAGWAFVMPFSILALALSAIPFMLIHLVSNLVFALFLPFARKIVNEKGKFDEKSVCLDIINRFGGNSKLNRLLHRKEAAEQ